MELKPEPAVLKMTIQVTRKETGNVETYELTGTPEKIKEEEHGSNPPDSGS